jgi:four helix bundle protein
MCKSAPTSSGAMCKCIGRKIVLYKRGFPLVIFYRIERLQVKMSNRKNLIVDKSLAFATDIVRFCDLLSRSHKYAVANQLLRSGTAIGANVFEAQDAESRADFIHKMKIAAKETSESIYWLLICERSETYPENSSLKEQALELKRLLSRIILSARQSV